jgi:hypothetical protein
LCFLIAVKAQLAVVADVSAQNMADVRKLRIDQKAGQYQRILAFWEFFPAIPAFHYISPLHAAESKSHHISCRHAFEFFRLGLFVKLIALLFASFCSDQAKSKQNCCARDSVKSGRTGSTTNRDLTVTGKSSCAVT